MARLGLAAEPRAGRGAAIPHRRGRAVRRARRAARNSASSSTDDDGGNEAVRRGRVMISTQQIQERRRDELLRRQLGPQLLSAIGTVADADHPIIEGELQIDRIRFEGFIPPVVRRPCFAMRKPAQVLYTLTDYVRDRIVTDSQKGIFREAIVRRENILIIGGTGSGKTTLGGALINEMVESSDSSERYVIIEDTLEIQCRAQNLVQLRTSESADLTRLVRATMRLRPDRIIIGEVRGGEALALLKAWNTGHPGGVTTIHA